MEHAVLTPTQTDRLQGQDSHTPLLRFDATLVPAGPTFARDRSTTAALSVILHAAILSVVVIVPLLLEEILPTPSEAVGAFFVAPPEVAPPPPPPPPPAAGARAKARTPTTQHPPQSARFVVPIEIPEEIVVEESLDLGVEGGVPGGVEGGVPGGVLGGIVGGLPLTVPPPPPAPVVRVGGHITPPALVKRVKPIYPTLAIDARVAGLVILEAHVDTRGHVKSVKILRGSPLLDEAAVAAVRQWRYRPLLLNGRPTEFLVSVTVTFNLRVAAGQ